MNFEFGIQDISLRESPLTELVVPYIFWDTLIEWLTGGAILPETISCAHVSVQSIIFENVDRGIGDGEAFCSALRVAFPNLQKLRLHQNFGEVRSIFIAGAWIRSIIIESCQGDGIFEKSEHDAWDLPGCYRSFWYGDRCEYNPYSETGALCHGTVECPVHRLTWGSEEA